MASKIKFGRCKVGKSQKCRFPYLCKIQKPTCTCCHISAMIAIRIGITERSPGTGSVRIPQLKCDQIRSHSSDLPYRPGSPAVLAAFPASSRPIGATTGPIAAVGSFRYQSSLFRTGGQSLPHTSQQYPEQQKPPRAYSYPYLLITRRAGERKAKLEPK